MGDTPTYYRAIVDCPLDKFIEATVNNNLYALVISGNPTIEQLKEALDVMVDEYTSCVGDGEQQLALNLYKQIVKLQANIEQVDMLIGSLRHMYVGKFVTMLNTLLSTIYAFDVARPEEYEKNLKGATTRGKNMRVALDIKLEQFEAMQKKQEKEGAVMTKSSFLGVLITLSDHAGYQLHLHMISVFDYCERISRLLEHIKRQEAKSK